MINIKQDLKALIDLALDLRDFEWVKELNNKMVVDNINSNQDNITAKQYIASMVMSNDTPVFLENNIAKIPITEEDLKNELVMAKSIKNNKWIKKDEAIDIQSLTYEEQYYYKAYYYGWIQGYEVAYNYYSEYISKQNSLEEISKQQIENLKQQKQIKDEKIKCQEDFIKFLEESCKSLMSDNKKKWWKFWR